MWTYVIEILVLLTSFPLPSGITDDTCSSWKLARKASWPNAWRRLTRWNCQTLPQSVSQRTTRQSALHRLTRSLTSKRLIQSPWRIWRRQCKIVLSQQTRLGGRTTVTKTRSGAYVFLECLVGARETLDERSQIQHVIRPLDELFTCQGNRKAVGLEAVHSDPWHCNLALEWSVWSNNAIHHLPVKIPDTYRFYDQGSDQIQIWYCIYIYRNNQTYKKMITLTIPKSFFSDQDAKIMKRTETSKGGWCLRMSSI